MHHWKGWRMWFIAWTEIYGWRTGDVKWLCRMCWMCFMAFLEIWRTQAERGEGVHFLKERQWLLLWLTFLSNLVSISVDNRGAQQDQRVLTPNWFREEAQKHRAQSVKHAEEEAYERKKTNYSIGQDVCSLVPCSLLRDLLEHLHSPHWRGWEWDVAHSNGPSNLWQLQQKSRTNPKVTNSTGMKEDAHPMTLMFRFSRALSPRLQF